jgi:hypothetical protein
VRCADFTQYAPGRFPALALVRSRRYSDTDSIRETTGRLQKPLLLEKGSYRLVRALMQKCLCWSQSHSVVLQLSIHCAVYRSIVCCRVPRTRICFTATRLAKKHSCNGYELSLLDEYRCGSGVGAPGRQQGHRFIPLGNWSSVYTSRNTETPLSFFASTSAYRSVIPAMKSRSQRKRSAGVVLFHLSPRFLSRNRLHSAVC